MRQAVRETLAAEIAAAAPAMDGQTRYDRRAVGQRVAQRFAQWRADIDGAVPRTRRLLREILTGPLVLTPTARAYQFAGDAAVGRVVAGEIGLPTFLVRPAGLEPATPGLGNRCSIHLSYGRARCLCGSFTIFANLGANRIRDLSTGAPRTTAPLPASIDRSAPRARSEPQCLPRGPLAV